MRVPFVDLARRHAEVGADVERRVLAVLRSGRWHGGSPVADAEAFAARALGRAGAVGVASGTDALILGLQALGVGPGDEVVVPALTFFATAGAVLALGAVPVVADVGRDALLDPIDAGAARTPRTRAVIPVHLFGSRCDPLPADVVAGLHVLDDAAQAIGTTPAPATGVASALSAYPTKTWGAAGDAGFFAADDPELLARVRALGQHGARAPGVHERVAGHSGRASRLDAVQAAVLCAHAEVLGARVARRRELAARYDAGLPRSVRPLPRTAGSAVHQYVVLAPDRDRLVGALAARGVDARVYYPCPLLDHPALAETPRRPLPTARALCAQLLALPIHDATDAEADAVLEALAAESA